MTYPTHLLPTTVVGSYPQPDWLVDRAALHEHGVPRTHAHGHLAHPSRPGWSRRRTTRTILAIRDMERAGIDIVTDGEIRRESYSNRFALALDGIDAEHPGEVRGADGRTTPVPRVVGRIRRRGPVEAARRRVPAAQHRSRDEDHAARPVHLVATGAERVLRRRGGDGDGLRRRGQRGTARAEGDRRRRGAARRTLGAHRRRRRRRATACARSTARWRASRGRPWCISASAMPRWCHRTTSRAATAFCRSLPIRSRSRFPSRRRSRSWTSACCASCRASRSCWACSISASLAVETAEQVAERIRAGLRYVAAERLIPAPDCGMKYLPRETAFGKLRALVEGAAIVRRELSG